MLSREGEAPSVLVFEREEMGKGIAMSWSWSRGRERGTPATTDGEGEWGYPMMLLAGIGSTTTCIQCKSQHFDMISIKIVCECNSWPLGDRQRHNATLELMLFSHSLMMSWGKLHFGVHSRC